ncbi:MAG TPA: type III-A CRISPR-associated RAMP protein Csm4 [Candidatus Kapabacteria bacterium]|jgi:CRISPR-associated protein Csm4|nr:type III-A CRISPR-associated RAMP protein Csm4 [Ignavibacteria bacterium]HOK13667.1 type III-A CRISPR-associated RAMP protein Csm4 [Candidatus Kapabacteria bacterium]HOM03947.1 type III-A CRISPR-associated RAMP protein Csm4 [Candidatus Kapabacteria bacterium]HPP40475.1 type III-A CRISPR-associated RAMP protein Csm4 [Candidatus Kapabacteria bacterium]HPU24149.1 type III-A CRISPR-associated RAMP protein Csm4 [Candidatus Kapabacteria bacterium]
MKIVYLYPKTSFSRIYDADFLFGITLTVMRYLKGEEFTRSVVESFEAGSPPFLFSNCFVFNKIDSRKRIYFPKPKLPTDEKEIETIKEYSKTKEFKSLRYLDLETFSRLIKGEITIQDIFEIFVNSKEKLAQPQIREVSVPHVQINRLTNSSEEEHFYHTDDLFIDNGGLYFLFEGDFSLVEPVFNFLNHYGLGRDASTGRGQFSYEVDEIVLEEPSDANAFINLSCYYPTADEIKYYQEHTKLLFYELETKEGKIFSNNYSWNVFRKKPVSYFAAGSVFPIINGKKHYGSIKEVATADNISIKFNGLSFPIKIKIRG